MVKFAGDALLALWPSRAARTPPPRPAACCAAALAMQAGAATIAPSPRTIRLSLKLGGRRRRGLAPRPRRRASAAGSSWSPGGPLLAGRRRPSTTRGPGDTSCRAEAWALVAARAPASPCPTAAPCRVTARARARPRARRRHARADCPPPSPALRAFIPARDPRAPGRRADRLARRAAPRHRRCSSTCPTSTRDAARPGAGGDAARCRPRSTASRAASTRSASTTRAPRWSPSLGLPPLAHEDDPARGVQAALAMQARLHGWPAAQLDRHRDGRVFCGAVGQRPRGASTP